MTIARRIQYAFARKTVRNRPQRSHYRTGCPIFRPVSIHSSFQFVSEIIRTSELHVALGGKDVLRGLSVRIPDGAMVGLVGPNGSGKTTFLRTIAGLLPYRGSVVFDDREIIEWPRRDLARRLAFVRQFQSLPFDFSVEELVLLGRTPHKGWLEPYDETDLSRVESSLSDLEVLKFRNRSVQEVSGGELQRVLLAQALVQETDVLLLDEPTAHLDVHHQFSFLAAVRRQTRNRRAIIAVFHDLELAARFADYLIVLNEGKCAMAGAPREVFTPDLLDAVFRMEAVVNEGPDGALRINYLGTATRLTSESS